MLGGLFKPAWQSPSAEKRLQAIAKLDANDEESLSALESLAKDDPAFEVRQAAIEKLPAISLFSQVIGHTDQATRAHAETVFALLIGPKSTLIEDDFRTLIRHQPNSRPLIAKLCPFAQLRAELLAEMPEAELAELITDIEYAETRKLIAERLQSLEHLEQARKAIKGRDKSAEKIIKSKIDVLRAKQKEAQENRETAEELCTKMEYLAAQEWRAEFKRRFLACRTQWDGLSFSPEVECQARYQHAFDLVSVEAERQEQIDQAHRAQEALAKALAAYCAEVAAESYAQVSNQLDAIKARRAQTMADWETSAATIRANLNVADQFFIAEGALTSLIAFIESVAAVSDPENNEDQAADAQQQAESLKQALSSLKWPKTYPELTSEKTISARLSELKETLHSNQKAQKEKLDKLHKRISRIQGAAGRGEINRARRELDAVTKAAKPYSGKDKAALDDRLEKAAAAVAKMGDWKDFATEPKYLELCEAMEALQTSDAHPDKLAENIKALQDKWKALGHSDSSEKYWERFKTAGDKAYEPCTAFFKERRETRKQNLDNREPLVSRTQAILEETPWDGQPDYKAIEVELRRIGDDWKKIKDVDPRAGQKQWKRFCTLKDAIYDKLSVVYDANIAVKKQLTEQAIALGETDINEQSLTRLQQIQTRWKQVGVTRRKDDQAAWKTFKAATDTVYEKIQGVRQVKRDEENQQLDGYRSIIKQIQDLAKSATDLAKADHSFERLTSEYQALPPLPQGLPEKLTEALEKDYGRACDFYGKSRDRILEAADREELNALREKARLCGQLEKIAATEGNETEIERLKSDIDEIEIHDRALCKRFDQRLSAALEPDKSEATERRRLLCIDVEILLGIESPAEDKALRMKIQFERMKTEGLGRANLNKSAAIDAFILDWLCLPGAAAANQATLEERFEKLTAERFVK